ncbi:MAG: hypothetical protein A2Y07_00300 [Planctomycetes bacterium GWF2_50_10]|nr:MAG: hypothetical protein A2Y07_00300 [Planctomycetes bacterium GWF2_50_10]
MNQNNDFNDNDDLIDALRKQLSSTPQPALQEKMKNSLKEFRQDLNGHPYIISKKYAGFFARIMDHKFVIAKISAAAAAAIISIFAFVFVSTGTPTYAQVNEQFKTVPYFTAMVYIKDSCLAKPETIELWMDNGRCRLLTGTQVVFGRNGVVEDAYDIVRSVKTEPDETAATIMRRIGSTNTFSLETLLSCLSSDKNHNLSFKNVPCELAQELTIFDKQLVSGDTDTIRVWALQKSKLPIQVRAINGNTSIDVFLFYSEKKPAAFFDAKAFSQNMSQLSTSPEKLAYFFYTADANR